MYLICEYIPEDCVVLDKYIGRAKWEIREEQCYTYNVAVVRVLVCEEGEKVSQCDSSHTERKYISSAGTHAKVLRLK